ncbi:hypothetical protein STEG23_017291, partial [Scotinomys teguina]
LSVYTTQSPITQTFLEYLTNVHAYGGIAPEFYLGITPSSTGPVRPKPLAEHLTLDRINLHMPPSGYVSLKMSMGPKLLCYYREKSLLPLNIEKMPYPPAHLLSPPLKRSVTMAPMGAQAAAANDLLLKSCDLISDGPGPHPSSSFRDSHPETKGGILPVCMSVHHVYAMFMEAREDFRSPRTGVIYSKAYWQDHPDSSVSTLKRKRFQYYPNPAGEIVRIMVLRRFGVMDLRAMA